MLHWASAAKIVRAALRNWRAISRSSMPPAGLFLHLPRLMGPPQWADMGLWLQTVMLLLVEAGLGSCAQEAWSAYPETVKGVTGIPDDHLLFCGLAIGWPEEEAEVNRFPNLRAPLEEVVRFLD